MGRLIFIKPRHMVKNVVKPPSSKTPKKQHGEVLKNNASRCFVFSKSIKISFENLTKVKFRLLS